MSGDGGTVGDFPAPPTADPGVALRDVQVRRMQHLHNWLGRNHPQHLAAAREDEDAVDVAIRLLGKLGG